MTTRQCYCGNESRSNRQDKKKVGGMVIPDSEVRGESKSTKRTIVVGKVGLGNCHSQTGSACFAEDMNQTNGVRYFNQHQRDE